ncbi:MAG: hypothetical protein HY295_06535 [Thaumarchaeota archaeon]|nr:hypothetical protein [Nitrososphaerota archaeon]
MEASWCYYIVPTVLGPFTVVMIFFLRRRLKKGPLRLENELPELSAVMNT